MNWDNLTASMPVAEGHTMPNGNMEPPFGDAFMDADINVLARHDGCHHDHMLSAPLMRSLR